MKDSGSQSEPIMPKYALYVWGIILSPVAAGIFLSLNILKVGKNGRESIINASVPFTFGLLYIIALIWPYHSNLFYVAQNYRLPFLGNFTFYLLQIAYTAFLIERNWSKFLS